MLIEDLRRGEIEITPYYFEVDMPFFHENLKDFLPDQIIDIHAHVNNPKDTESDWEENASWQSPSASWPQLVSPHGMSLPSLLASYILMFPGKYVKPMIFGGSSNEYVATQAKRFNLWSLIRTIPSWSVNELEKRVKDGGFNGLKPYPTTVKKPGVVYDQSSVEPGSKIREIDIFDFIPRSHLELANEKKWLVMIHIPRAERLSDPVNIKQLLEIDNKYSDAKVIVAHVGRAYCPRYGIEGLDALKNSQNLLFDISANTNQTVFEKLIETVGPDRILFGSDMPIFAVHARRICEGDNYVNIVLDAFWKDSHTRYGSPEDRITFFLYEEIAAFKRAAEEKGLDEREIKKIFFENARRILE
jgi:predicted TIM-barrel fold metal-dependent hydrolase